MYDANGNLVERTDARGVVTTFAYDDLNRVTAKAYVTPSPTPANYQNTPSVTYTYDNLTNSKGHLTKVESSISTTEYTEFDILGRILKSKQTTDGTTYGNGSTDSYMTYSYNLAGMLIEQQYPSGRRVQNVLDNDGQLEMVKSRKNAGSGYWAYANNLAYAATGAVKSMQLGNGTWESTVFNNRMQPTQIALGTVKDGYDKLKLTYSYGDWSGGSIVASKNSGNIVQQVITVPNSSGQTDGFTATQKYYYDSLNRIDYSVETISGETWQQDFDYDRYGNRTFVEGNTDFFGFLKECGGNMCSDLKKKLNPAIGSANRLSTSDGYVFDSGGNMTKDANLRRFTFDGENKQVKVETVDSEDEVTGLVGEYWYDGDGRRVKKYVPYVSEEIPGEVTVFVYDAFGKQIAEYSVNVETTNAKVGYITSDHLGSPRINTEKNGGVTARHDYHPFGEEIITDARTGHAEYGGDKVRKQFTGYERDKETELDFAQARMYKSNIGRFLTADPFPGSARPSTPQSWNRYAYVLNQPMTLTDPTGLDPFWGYREVECGKGEMCKQFVYFRNETEFETYNSIYPGFQKWTGPQFYLTGLKQAFALGSDGRSMDFSLQDLSDEEWNSLVRAQEGGQFTADQITAVNRELADAVRGSEEGQQAIDNTLNVATIGMAGTERRAMREIALGVERLGSRMVLGELAEQTGSSAFRQWGTSGLTRRSVNNHFGRAFNQAADRSDRIHFALDGLLDDMPGAVRRGKKGFFQGNFTNAELSTIYRNPNLFSKTQFYFNNNPVSPLFRP